MTWDQRMEAAGHVKYVCTRQHDDGGWTCQTCAGGLFSCTRCGQAEGGLADTCPGSSPNASEVSS